MDVQKTMEFILEQQAAFAAGMQELEARSLAHQADIEAHTEWLSGLSGALQTLTDQMQDGFVKMAAAHKELAASHKDTREELNIQRENLNILFRTVQDILPRLPKQ